MARLSDSINRSTGGFSPTGIFSLEFFKRPLNTDPSNPVDDTPSSQNSIGEYFFLIGFSKFEQIYSYNIQTRKTYGGSAITDYGNGHSIIQVSGELYTGYRGAVPRRPASSFAASSKEGIDGIGENISNAASNLVDNSVNLLKSYLDELNPMQKTAYLDLMDLMYLLHQSRDKKGYNVKAPTYNPTFFTAWDVYEANFGKNPQAENIDFENNQIVFHNYDKDEHWEVSFDPNAFSITQSNDDTLTYQFSIKLIGLREIFGSRKFRRPAMPDFQGSLNNALVELEGLLNDISEPLKYVKSITDAFNNLNSVKDQIKASITNFNNTNKRTIKDTRFKFRDGKKKSKLLKIAIETYLHGLTVSSPTPPSETEIQSGSNSYTDPNADFTAIANDKTYQENLSFESIVNRLDVIAIERQNGFLNQSETTGLPVTQYKVQPGETIESITLDKLGSLELVDEILSINPDLPEDLTGLTILIPGSESNTALPENTGVILEQDASLFIDPLSLEKAIFGTDLALDETRDLAIQNGDLAALVGSEALVQNLLDQLRFPTSPVPLTPDFTAGWEPGSLPEEFLGTAGILKILNKLEASPVVSETVLHSYKIEANSIYFVVEVIPIGGFDSFFISSVVKI